jgi:hypothetical protein
VFVELTTSVSFASFPLPSFSIETLLQILSLSPFGLISPGHAEFRFQCLFYESLNITYPRTAKTKGAGNGYFDERLPVICLFFRLFFSANPASDKVPDTKFLFLSKLILAKLYYPLGVVD